MLARNFANGDLLLKRGCAILIVDYITEKV